MGFQQVFGASDATVLGGVSTSDVSNTNHGFDASTCLKSHFEMDDVDGNDENSWTLTTDEEQTAASSQADTPTLQSDVEEFGGGELEGAPNNRCGGSCPVASKTMSGVKAVRALHANVSSYIEDEMKRLDATSEEQSCWIGAVTEAIHLKAMLEGPLEDIQHQTIQDDLDRVNQEFLVTKTMSNQEVWSNLNDWKPSIEAEFEQLVNTKKAVRQVAKGELQRLAKDAGLPTELLPAKMVHTRKAGSGAFRSRAVVCGNYQEVGGADGNQIRSQIRLASLKGWSINGTDIRVSFLNSPKRDDTKITAMWRCRWCFESWDYPEGSVRFD